MKPVIVGTAGHIDHGKTALVRALTGIDADRLEEEKRRGITIDLGFAHLELAGADGRPLRLGFVDVPGHERFVRNMLAGVGGIDLVLFVVAADEGIKPQSREHFDICRLLGIARGIPVLTKRDLVDAETLEVVRLELEEFLRGSFLDPRAAGAAPIVAVSANSGEGMEQLKQALAQAAAAVQVRDAEALPRLPIDRVFTMKGFGTVVTGTLISGTVGKEQELEALPGGRRVRVRGVQVHNQAAEAARAGERTALNLAGASTDELARGMVLAPVELFQATRRADVSLTLLPGARALRDRSRVHLYAYTAETVAEVVPHEAKEMKPGESGWAQLRLAEAMLLLPGDRFILRQFSPVVTIGGGVVLDAAPLPRPRSRALKSALPAADLRAFLQTLAGGSAPEILHARVARRGGQGLTLREVAGETGWSPARLEAELAPLLGEGRLARLGETLVSVEALQRARAVALAELETFHRDNPLVAGISREELRTRLSLPPVVFAGLLEQLAKDAKAQVQGELVQAAGRGVVMQDEEADSKRQIEQAFAAAGLKVPALKDVLAGLRVDKARAQKIVTLLLRERVLVKLADDLVFHRDALEELRRRVTAHKAVAAKIDVSRFKELTGITRKYAIPLLEYLDRERVTRRVGDERIIL